MTEPARHSVSVAGVIVDDEGRVLLTRRRDNGHWEPPGGVLEFDETIDDGLRREVHEETGLTVEPVGLTGVYKNMRAGVVALVFRCQRVRGQLQTNDEVEQFRWTFPDEAMDLMTPAYAVRVADALSARPGPAIRAHNGTTVL